MPTATSFNALGAGNGFPFCLDRVNMNDLNGDGTNIAATLWTTMGGTQKGSAPTAGEIGISLTNAMRVFWNLYSVETEIGLLTIVTDFLGNPFEPVNRVCNDVGYWGAQLSASNGSIAAFGSPVRMYDGDSDDENNFVGYGASSVASSVKSLTGAPQIGFFFQSWTASPNSIQRQSEYSSSFAGIPMVAGVSAQAASVITINELTANIDPISPAFTSNNTLTYSNIGFYTY